MSRLFYKSKAQTNGKRRKKTGLNRPFSWFLRVLGSMTHYNKGASAERELLALLYMNGMAVCRAAGSGKGKNTIPTPDAIALRNGKIYAFECKAWKAKNLNISQLQMNDLEKWCRMAGAELLIAWKVPNRGWLFLRKEDLHTTGKAFAISKKRAFEIGKKIEYFTHAKLPEALSFNPKD